jgi:hypothetical protein
VIVVVTLSLPNPICGGLVVVCTSTKAIGKSIGQRNCEFSQHFDPFERLPRFDEGFVPMEEPDNDRPGRESL